MIDLAGAKMVLANAFQIEPTEVPDDAGLETLEQWDSLGHVQVLMSMETAMGRKLTTEETLEIIDLASLQSVLDANE